ncbi:MAG: hypothetical protein E7374_04045 [Clostridiales bacterium]|nr:hypothetical protein [Clostridiales bacterium]
MTRSELLYRVEQISNSYFQTVINKTSLNALRDIAVNINILYSNLNTLLNDYFSQPGYQELSLISRKSIKMLVEEMKKYCASEISTDNSTPIFEL